MVAMFIDLFGNKDLFAFMLCLPIRQWKSCYGVTVCMIKMVCEFVCLCHHQPMGNVTVCMAASLH